MKIPVLFAAALMLAFVTACGDRTAAPPTPAEGSAAADANGNTAPSAATARANAAVNSAYDFSGTVDFDEARRGLVETDPEVSISAAASARAWSPKQFQFVDGDAPASVNPSLWRQAKLNNNNGLFQVAEGIYQVRGYDISNMSWIRGKRDRKSVV